ncbi:MAG: MFS transporter [Promethearchaeati archaeon SRVP18_Atabeyarchaeia-1]
MFKEFSELRHITNFKRVILPVSVAFFVYTGGWGIASPVFSIYIQNVTGDLFMTGVILSLTTMMGIFLNIPVGLAENRINMKRVLQVVLLVYSILALLYTVANSFLPLLLVSVTRGVASSFLWLTSWAYIFSYAEKEVKGKETGFFSDMNDLASAIFPIIGGLVTIISFSLPFYLLSLTSFTAFLVISIFLKNIPRSQRAHSSRQTATLFKYMRNRRFIKTIFLTVVFYALINVYYSFLSVLLYSEGIPIPTIGTLLTVALLPAVALEVPMGNAVDRFGVRRTLIVATVFTTVTAILIPLPSSIIPFASSIYYTMAILTAFTVSYTMIFIVLYSRMSDTLGENKVAMTGAIAAFKDVGYTLGPLMAGVLMGFMSINMTFLFTGAAFILLIPVAITLHD